MDFQIHILFIVDIYTNHNNNKTHRKLLSMMTILGVSIKKYMVQNFKKSLELETQIHAPINL